MDTPDRAPVAEPLSSTATAIPIAQLSPELDRLRQSSINAVVTLLWPYSSSTKSLSLLLAEPDFRLRRPNGQVKVFFHGHVAQDVARTHIGIGDNVRLSLAGSRLEKNDAATQAPGRGISWDVHFDASAFIEVWRDSNLLSTVKIDRSSATPPPTDIITETSIAAPRTPVANGIHASEPLGSTSWQSPAFLGKSRVFGLTHPAIDPTVEEDGYVPGKGRKRPRFSMRSNEWRLVDEPESPGDRDLPEDWMAIFDEELANGSDAEMEDIGEDTEESTIPPSLERASEVVAAENIDAAVVDDKADALASGVNQHVARANDDAQFLHPSIVPRSLPEFNKLSDGSLNLPTDTPRLHPIPSPGLPAPSPFPTASSPGGYFMPINGAASAAQSIIPPASVPENISEIRDFIIQPPAQSDVEPVHADEDVAESEDVSDQDDSAIPPQAQPDDEPTRDDDDAVTVYTDDVQILASSPRAPEAKATTKAVVDDEENSQEEEASEDDAVDATRNAATGGDSDGSGSEQSESEESGAEESESESEQEVEEEVKKADDQRYPEQLDQEEDYESHGVSSELGEDEENDAVVERVPKHDVSQSAQRKSLSQEDDREVSEDSEQPDDYDEEERLERDDEDASDRYDYEEDYEDEEQEESRGEYDYSESEAESDYEEEPPPRPAPKKAEPEIIVLDSDSEDEAPPQRPVDTGTHEKQQATEEDSYGSEDEEEVYDGKDNEEEPEHERFREDQEDQENEDDYEQEAGEYQIDEEMGDVGEEEGYAKSTVEKQPVRGWHSEREEAEVEEDVHEDDIAEDHYKEVQEQSAMTFEATSAEPSFEAGQVPANDFSTSHGYAENLQAASEYTQGPNHGSLDYLATISESAQRLQPVTEARTTGYEMAIDPSLYEFAPPNNTLMEPDEDHQQQRAAGTNETAIESIEDIRERHLALQLDGAAPPVPVPEFPLKMASTSHEQQQLVTPGPSQQIEVYQASGHEVSHDMLPTPSLTQETLLKMGTEQPPQPLTETSTHGELQHPPAPGAIKSENEPNDIKQEEHEPETPRTIVDGELPRSPDQDQKLQASIEVDEQATDDINSTQVNRHYPGLRSKLSYFAPLATLIDHYNALVDTISIVSEFSPPTKATTGKDYILTLQLTDPSMAGTTIYAQILRPFEQALPNPKEGDAILLRNFRVKSLDHAVILISDDTSAWAVFSPSYTEPEVTGPPVEYGAEETNFATDLRQWYVEDGLAMVADNQLQASVGREMSVDMSVVHENEPSRPGTPGSDSLAPSDADALSIGDDLALREMRGDTISSRGSRRRKSHRRITIHELRDGRRYTEVGSSPGDSSIHELRDGTVYANL
ncbi:hypothetical protein BDV06DRAFT_38703 [Aspergillus oleicola]